MRVRILKNFITAGRAYQAGTAVDVSSQEAITWGKSGLVMQDKSLDGASETKDKLGTKPARKRRKTKK